MTVSDLNVARYLYCKLCLNYVDQSSEVVVAKTLLFFFLKSYRDRHASSSTTLVLSLHECFCVVLYICTVCCFLWTSWYRLHRKVQCPQLIEDSLPGVSILKPLTGVDPNLFANLETFFNIKYPTVSRHWYVDNALYGRFFRFVVAQFSLAI